MANTKPKGAPGGSQALSFFVAGAKALIVIISVLAVLVVGWLAWWWYRPELFLDPVNRFVHVGFLDCRDGGDCLAQGTWASMVPDVFALGEPRQGAVQRVLDAGFSFSGVYRNEEHYGRMGAAFSPFPCTRIYNLRLMFDHAGKLAIAESSYNGSPSCL
jgi:hypothetical protein